MKVIRILTFFIFVAVSSIYSQFQLIESQSNARLASIDTTFLSNSKVRRVIKLPQNWKVFIKNDAESQRQVYVPSLYKGAKEVIYENYIFLSKEDVEKTQLELNFLGVSYNAEIAVNNNVIYKHSGGHFPFSIDLPKDILRANSSNILTVKISNTLESDETIPVKQRFWFPENLGGIFRDVYLIKKSNVNISSTDLSVNYEPSYNKAVVNIGAKIINFIQSKRDTAGNYSIYYQILSPENSTVVSYQTSGFGLNQNKEKYVANAFTINSPQIWTPNYPQNYKLKIQLFSNGVLIDEITQQLSVYSLNMRNNGLSFNGLPFQIHGVTYVPSYGSNGVLMTYEQMENDIKIIKGAGFNAVRFIKSIPHPYLLKLCADYGLLAFIEVPINSIPEEICNKDSFKDRTTNYLGQFLHFYNNYSAFAALGLGGGYLSNSEKHAKFLSDLTDYSRKIIGKKLIYASFVGYDFNTTLGLDLYGIELVNTNVNYDLYAKAEAKLGQGKVFISEATYSTYRNGTNGYLNAHSYEAQAKYFSELIDEAKSKNTTGFFLNSMFDYRSDFSSFVTGYNSLNILNLGILGEDRQATRLTYRVISSKLNDGEKVTIPIGNKKDEDPILFIAFGILLTFIVGLFINKNRKFREDTTRALLRPYNFFADIRDLRLISRYHSNVLFAIVVGSTSLILSNLAFVWRDSILLEKLLMSFGSEGLVDFMCMVVWHPVYSILAFALIVFFTMILMSFVIKLCSLFLKNKVYYSSIYFMIIWSFLPTILLLPVGLILARVLNLNVVNPYIYIALTLYVIWLVQRLLQGVYVIFDTIPSKVYFFAFIIFIAVTAIFALYFQLTESTIYYLMYAVKQFRLLV